MVGTGYTTDNYLVAAGTRGKKSITPAGPERSVLHDQAGQEPQLIRRGRPITLIGGGAFRMSVTSREYLARYICGPLAAAARRRRSRDRR